MKNAEEWMNNEEYQSFGICTKTLIKQIQLDAWKQGMNDAAIFVDEWHPFDKKDNITLAQEIREYSEERKTVP